MLGGAAAAEHRDPHSVSASLSFGPCLPTTMVTFGARFDFGAGRRELVGDPADLLGDFGFFFLRRSGPGRRRAALRPLRAFPCRSRSAPSSSLRPWRRRSRPRSRAAAPSRRSAPGGSPRRPAWRFLLLRRSGVRPRPRICCTATERCVPTSTGTLASFWPLETVRTTVEPRVAVVPPRRFGADHQTGFDLVGVDLFGPRRRSRLLRAFLPLLPGSGPAARRAPWRCPGPELTVSATFGFEQKKLRKAQSSEALPAGGSCSSTVLAATSRCTRLIVADLEAVLFEQRRSRRSAGCRSRRGRRCVVSRVRAKPSRSADQHRGERRARSTSCGAALLLVLVVRALPRRRRPGAAAARRQRCRPHARRGRATPRRAPR